MANNTREKKHIKRQTNNQRAGEWDADGNASLWEKLVATHEMPVRIKKLNEKLKSYGQSGLNAEGINESLFNIYQFYNMPATMSDAREHVKPMISAANRIKKHSSHIDGDALLNELSTKTSEFLEHIKAVETRINFYNKELVTRVGKKQKRPSLSSVHRIESGLVYYFHATGYSTTLEAAYKETLLLLGLIGRSISDVQLGSIYTQYRASGDAQFEAHQIKYCGIRV